MTSRFAIVPVAGLCTLVAGYFLPCNPPAAQATATALTNACLIDDGGWVTADGGCTDVTTGLVWSLAAPGSVDWNYAQNYGANLVEGGYSDWRMPTEAELQGAWANGAPTHLAYPGPAIWSTRTQGRYAYWVGLCTDGRSHRTLKGSYLTGVFVRDANAGGD